jgi:hypothetical protein
MSVRFIIVSVEIRTVGFLSTSEEHHYILNCHINNTKDGNHSLVKKLLHLLHTSISTNNFTSSYQLHQLSTLPHHFLFLSKILSKDSNKTCSNK